VNNFIKIGVFLDGRKVPFWVKRIIEAINKLDFVDLQLVCYTQELKAERYNKSIFYRLHEQLEYLIFTNQINYSRHVDISEFVEGLNEILIVSDRKSCLKEISSFNLDVILNFSAITLKNPDLVLARYGVWTCMLEYQNVVKESSNVYWAVVDLIPIINVVISCSNDALGKKTIKHTSCLATNFNLLMLNTVPALDLFAIIIPRLLTKTYLNYFYNINYNQNTISFINGAINRPPPTNWQAIKNMLQIVMRYLSQRIFNNKTTKWFLMYKFSASSIPSNLKDYDLLLPGRDCFWADPFVQRVNDKNYLFIEEFSYKKGKGHIAYLEVDASGKVLKSETILERPYHMSYPFVFDVHATKYMIPETSQNSTIDLYQCIEFPGKWSFVMSLMDRVVAKDTTLFYHNNKWWMFTAIKETHKMSKHIELFLYYADTFKTTNWESHPLNPISTDIRCSRPAGKIFINKGRIYRPSQDCSIRYGRALNISEITKLSETEYEEVLISKIEAERYPNLKGIHTFNSDNNLSVVDAYH